ncbi:LacI family transcriptional regulator [Stagnihabitans tardus]|uniref:LacI family DNA-binding transcriptional regulator n=1 Tax=Stagnihabitans tardus TaxID=2699202 RepID=A0AAE5BW14_9RHOB|nr:LacI family transcriptional regulator [Stagnihabitans tardus]NBZ87858.1 LacI family DNA-binding transcriptional regulator [Stagnihabitans tardus]
MASAPALPPSLPLTDSERPTLKTIAAETGLAVATVSRALKDAPDIGEETKKRVRAAAARLGYRPNRAGVRLRTGKTNVIALVLSPEADVMNHTSRLLYSIANELRGTAYHLVVMPFFADQDPMDPIRYVVETGSADGVILNQTKPDDPRVRYLAEHQFPFATHGRTDMGLEHPYFDFDNEAFGRLAAAELFSRGRKRLLLVPPPRSHCYAGHMITGFAEEAAARGVVFEVTDEVTSDSPAAQIEAALAARLKREPRIDGVVCGSTTSAMATVSAGEIAGREIGRDYDLAAKEAFRFLHRFRREILVMPEDVTRAGSFLARAVMAAIERRAPEESQGLETPAGFLRPEA